MAATHKGECFCGTVHVEASGEHVNYAETVLRCSGEVVPE